MGKDSLTSAKRIDSDAGLDSLTFGAKVLERQSYIGRIPARGSGVDSLTLGPAAGIAECRRDWQRRVSACVFDDLSGFFAMGCDDCARPDLRRANFTTKSDAKRVEGTVWLVVFGRNG